MVSEAPVFSSEALTPALEGVSVPAAWPPHSHLDPGCDVDTGCSADCESGCEKRLGLPGVP